MSRTVVITGANRGIGFEFVRQCHAAGDRVVATYRSAERSEELLQLCKNNGSIDVQQLEVSDPRSVSEFGRWVLKQRVTINLLINNAGMGGGWQAGITDIDSQRMLHVIDVNAVGPLRVTQALLPAMDAGSTVVHISSLMGSIEDNESGNAMAYRASKTALNSVMKTMALEFEKTGMSTICFHPGWVRTELGGDDAPLMPEDSVAGMLKVISELTAEDNGSFLQYDGARLPW
jgi:NAD(P)-dependent dehydrogenase (short-subunit alcohol dehydrogenase family)